MHEKQKNIMKQLENLDKVSENEINYSDSDDMSKIDFSNFELYKKQKKQITIRLDKDVLDFFKKMGKGYQTKINQVLKEYKKQKVL